MQSRALVPHLLLMISQRRRCVEAELYILIGRFYTNWSLKIFQYYQRKTEKSTRVIFCWIILFVNCAIVTNAIIPRRELCICRINTTKIVDGAQQCLCALCDLNSNGFRKLLLIWFYLVCEIILFRLNGVECPRPSRFHVSLRCHFALCAFHRVQYLGSLRREGIACLALHGDFHLILYKWVLTKLKHCCLTAVDPLRKIWTQLWAALSTSWDWPTAFCWRHQKMISAKISIT